MRTNLQVDVEITVTMNVEELGLLLRHLPTDLDYGKIDDSIRGLRELHREARDRSDIRMPVQATS